MQKFQIKTIKTQLTWQSLYIISIEIDVQLRCGSHGTATAFLPWALPLSDNNKELHPYIEAKIFVETKISPLLNGNPANDQKKIDTLLTSLLDQQAVNKMKNCIISATSLANLKAAAAVEKIPLWQYVGTFILQQTPDFLPIPEIGILRSTNFASPKSYHNFGIIPIGATTYLQALINSSIVLKKLYSIKKIGPSQSIEETLQFITNTFEMTGFKPDYDFAISLNFVTEKLGKPNAYTLENNINILSRDQLCGKLIDWIEKYPIASIRDPFHPEDNEGWERLNWAVGKRLQLAKTETQLSNSVDPNNQKEEMSFNWSIIEFETIVTVTNMKNRWLKRKKNNRGVTLTSNIEDNNISSITHLSIGLGVRQFQFNNFISGNEGLRITSQIHEASKREFSIDGSLPPRSMFPWK